MSVIDLTSRYPVANVPFRPTYSIAIQKLVIHHLEFGDLPETATEVEELAVLDAVYAFHVNTRHWGGTGYHGIAFRSGRAYLTADWTRWGAHTYEENDDSRGFAVVGDWSDRVPPLWLQRSLAQLVEMHDNYMGAEALLRGHRDYVATTCPGNPYRQWVPGLRNQIEEDDMDADEVKGIVRNMRWQGGSVSWTPQQWFDYTAALATRIKALEEGGGSGYTDADARKAIKDRL